MPKYDVTVWFPLGVVVEADCIEDIRDRDVDEAFMEQYEYNGKGYVDVQLNYSGHLDWQANWEIEEDEDA